MSTPRVWKNLGEEGAIPISADNLNALEGDVSEATVRADMAAEAAELAATNAEEALSMVQSSFEQRGTTLGRDSADETGIIISVSSVWGINEENEPYYNDDGVESGEEAILLVEDGGTLALRRIDALEVEL
jgi:hypothetical protein